MYLAFDPGKHTGVASFDKDGGDLSRGVMDEDRLDIYLSSLIGVYHRKVNERPQVLEIQRPTLFIVEGFYLNKDKAIEQTGSDMPACRAIGKIELCASIIRVPIEWQRAGILHTATKWAGIKSYRGHLPDELSAYAHGVHWLIENKIRRHPVLDD